MLVCRIKWHIMPKLQARQYGFMPQRGTEDSLYDLMTHIYNELSLKKIILMVSLDIEGAFDNAWWPAIRNQLLAHKCPVNLYGMVMGYLRDREVVVRYAGGESRRMTSKGCIQGSIAGPTFWNLVLDSLLQELGDLGVYVQAFADDVVLMFSGQSASVLEAEANRALAHVSGWGDRNKLRFAPSKTNAMVLTKKLKFDVPTICMGHTTIALVDEIRLLGLTIDKRLTFVPHVSKACKKAANIYKGIARAAKATWGLSPEIVRTIYVAVIEPIVMYASCAWAPAASKLGVRKMLDAIQRSIALKACRAYRTVSLHSALILSRLLPLDIRVREAAWLYEVKRGKHLRDICADRELESPVDFCELPHPAHIPELGFESVEDLDPTTMDRLAIVGPHIYTDGSKIEGKVGAALTEWRDGVESGNSAYRLESFCTVFQAEMFALHRAIKRVKKGKDRLVNIFSDSKSSLQMLTGPTTYNPLAHAARRDILDIVAEGRGVRLFWVRAHAGTAGNERADELARNAALKKKTTADYDRFPLSFAKKAIRAASLDEWQKRYAEGSTGDITKCLFPRVKEAYGVLSRVSTTPLLAQTLTGHGGFAQYLHRFKLASSPYCACAPDKTQDLLHVLEECPIFLKERAETEVGIGVQILRENFPDLLNDDEKRKCSSLSARVVRRVGRKTGRRRILILTVKGQNGCDSTLWRGCKKKPCRRADRSSVLFISRSTSQYSLDLAAALFLGPSRSILCGFPYTGAAILDCVNGSRYRGHPVPLRSPIFSAGTPSDAPGAAAADTATGGTAVTSSGTATGAVVATHTVAEVIREVAETLEQLKSLRKNLSDFRGLIRRHRGLRRRPKPRSHRCIAEVRQKLDCVTPKRRHPAGQPCATQDGKLGKQMPMT
ncbi:Putative 115 kDa protein in type-1 retrotransposable element R1DM [Eumeta japonica]|uniref:115 kDa protein in type-1 retrotransposable element R1DM n=1 Tax=Eumeta variegata TaxID=151549 RepID=A0A4C1ZSY2_EUMVA|nr:Putative 115 kDa protein in type-1 retrotransposable element R1DM [Eumeta japonica]